MTELAVCVVLVVAAILFIRCTVLSHDRIRRMRWRIRLHMRPGPGFASRSRSSRCAGDVSRRCTMAAGPGPGLRFRHRLLTCTTGYAVRLGRGQWFRRCYGRFEDQVLIMAAPRTGKSGMVADRVLDHPGPVLVASTRADLYERRPVSRARAARSDVFNPQGVGDVPSTLQWDLLGPCTDLVMARRMASRLKVPGVGGGAMVSAEGRSRADGPAVGRRGNRPHHPRLLRVGAAPRARDVPGDPV